MLNCQVKEPQYGTIKKEFGKYTAAPLETIQY